MFNWIKRIFIKRAVGKQLKELDTDNLAIIAEEFLKRTQQKYSTTLKNAEKINQAKLYSLKESELRKELSEGLSDDEEEEEESEDGTETMIKQFLINKFLGNGVPQSNVPLETKGGDGLGKLVSAFTNLPSDEKQKLIETFINGTKK